MAACSDEQRRARDGQGAFADASKVMARLKGAAGGPKNQQEAKLYRGARQSVGISSRRKGKATLLEVPDDISRDALEGALQRFLDGSPGE